MKETELDTALAELRRFGAQVYAMASDAERARLSRERRAAGIRCVTIELSIEAVEAAVAAQILPEDAGSSETAFLLGAFLESALQRIRVTRDDPYFDGGILRRPNPGGPR